MRIARLRPGAAALLGLLAAACAGPERPNVLLVVVDTLRRDHLGCYGDARGLTPNVDALAAVSTRYTRAWSQAPWTTPSIGALLSSRYPAELGIRDVRSPLPPDVPLLAEVLRGARYATGAAIGHSFCSRRWGFARGFDSFDETGIVGEAGRSAPHVARAAIEFIDAHRDEPFFLFLHFFDPHSDYLLHERFAPQPRDPAYDGPIGTSASLVELVKARDTLTPDDLREVERLYASEVAYTDHHVGLVLDRLRDSGLFDGSLIVFTADHGEEFLDHERLGHTHSLYDELVRVPLLVKLPHGEAGVSDAPAALVDVFPTLLQALGLEAPDGLRGRSLLDPSRDEPVPVFSETSRHGDLRAVVWNHQKLVFDVAHAAYGLFDLARDPGERRNLAGRRPEVVRALARRLRRWMDETRRARAATAPRVEIPEEERERLRGLGYVD